MAYTFDAGPNAVLIAHNRKAATQLLQKLLFCFPPNSDADLDRYIVFQCQGHNRILVPCFGGYDLCDPINHFSDNQTVFSSVML